MLTKVRARLASIPHPFHGGENKRYANEIIEARDHRAVGHLLNLLSDRNERVKKNSIRVLHEISSQSPKMIAPHAAQVLEGLRSPCEMMRSESLYVLCNVSPWCPELVAANLKEIAAITGGISRNEASPLVKLLSALASDDQFYRQAFDVLLEVLTEAPASQLPTYADYAAEVCEKADKSRLQAVLNQRLPEVQNERHQGRLQKVIHRLVRIPGRYHREEI